jgi:DNA-binding CsgD family transcriptional regulator
MGTEPSPPKPLCLYAVPRTFVGMRVSAPDVRRIVQFLDAALSSARADAFPPSTLSALTKLIDADQADYFEVRPDRSAVAFTMAFEEQPAPSWVDDVLARVAHQNPLGAFIWGPADGPLRMSEVISDRKLRRLDYYNDILRPAHIRDRLRVWLWRSRETAACVTLMRSGTRFSDRDSAVLAVLQPHLIAMRERALVRPDLPDEADLTIREAQVVTLAATGRSNAEIAQLLLMSHATVAKHLEHTYQKLRVTGRAEVAAALRIVSTS